RGRRVAPFRLLRRPALGWWLGFSAVFFLVVDIVGLARSAAPGPAGVWVRDHSNVADRLFVWGTGDRATGLYLDADRLPASRYIGNYPLTGHLFGLNDHARNTSARVAPDAWPNLMEDLHRRPPRFIIDADQARPDHPWPIARYPLLSGYVQRHYRLAHIAPDGFVYQRR
ncbi:MAG TPA: hypothetical protein VNH46_07580, partial [Gemmatimonadales bacterium]|nr:hypothetical protein [Gemmatimonadales bacterium]